MRVWRDITARSPQDVPFRSHFPPQWLRGPYAGVARHDPKRHALQPLSDRSASGPHELHYTILLYMLYMLYPWCTFKKWSGDMKMYSIHHVHHFFRVLRRSGK